MEKYTKSVARFLATDITAFGRIDRARESTGVKNRGPEFSPIFLVNYLEHFSRLKVGQRVGDVAV